MYKFVADPYWIKADLIWENHPDEDYEGNYPSFVSLGLNRPGTLIEIEVLDGPQKGQLRQYLLGDLDEWAHNGDWRAFDMETIVKRYKILLEKDESEKETNS